MRFLPVLACIVRGLEEDVRFHAEGGIELSRIRAAYRPIALAEWPLTGSISQFSACPAALIVQ